MSRPDIIAAKCVRGSSLSRSSADGLAQGFRAFVRAAERDQRHRVAQDAGAHRVALGVVGVEEAFRRRPLDHLSQLPSEIHRILDARIEALSTVGGMHMGRVAGQEDPPVAIGRGLPRHVGEPGDSGRTVHPVIGPIDRDERLAELARWVARGSDVSFSHHHPDRAGVLVFDLVVDGLVLRRLNAWTPMASWRMPSSGTVISTWATESEDTRGNKTHRGGPKSNRPFGIRTPIGAQISGSVET